MIRALWSDRFLAAMVRADLMTLSVIRTLGRVDLPTERRIRRRSQPLRHSTLYSTLATKDVEEGRAPPRKFLGYFDRNGVDDEVALVVLAALQGAHSLDAALTG